MLLLISETRQHQLLPETWIDLFLDGDVPAVLTGKIVHLEEDMIEISTYPDEKTIYIDFEYKGLPTHLPIENISPFTPPKKSPEEEKEEMSSLEEEEDDIEQDLDLIVRLERLPCTTIVLVYIWLSA